jgi:hypothetical protein
MAIIWEIAPRTRLDIAAFEGLSCAGERHEVNIYAVGGRQGDLPSSVRSMAISGPVGIRIILMTDGPNTPLDQQSWRCINLTKKNTFLNKSNAPALRIPDLDWLDAFDARRSDPDTQCSYEQVSSIEEGTEWTFGYTASKPLKGNIRYIKIEPIPTKA